MRQANDLAARLPSLAALRAIEAAARRQSFTAAAAELGLTQGAVSHLVKSVEEQLGRPLFTRAPRGARPTAAGAELAEAVRSGIGLVADALARAAAAPVDDGLRVAVYAGFAVKWLFPRLLRFEEQHPAARLRIAAIVRLTEEDEADADVVVRYGHGRYPGLFAERILGRELMFPVCSPRLLAGRRPLRRPADLAQQVLLHDAIDAGGGMRSNWARWLRRAGLAGIDPRGGLQYGLSTTTLQAAVEGLGVAMGRSALVVDDLAAGRLVRPFGPAMPSGLDYHFVCARERVGEPPVAALLAWLRPQSATPPAVSAARPRERGR